MRKLLLATSTVLLIATIDAAAAVAPTVQVGDNFFKPKSVTVRHGTKVSWHWVGMLMHNVTFVSGPKGARSFHSKTVNKGDYSHVFTTKGKYLLVCTIHGFTMTVKVT